MARTSLIRQGESLPFSFDRGDETITGWTCTIEVRQHPGDSAIISRLITPADSKWTGFLTQTETAALSIGLYRLIAKLVKTSTDEEEQIVTRLQVSEAFA